MIINRKLLAVAVACVSANTGFVSAETSTLEEVVVTAEKRATDLQDTPIAIIAFQQDQLEAMQVVDIKTLGLAIPSLQAPSFPTNGNNLALFIRGVGNADSNILTKDNTVGVYIDGVYIARTTGLVTDILDLERIEVLRGPQGTLYGRNTTAGAINLISVKPSDEAGFKQQLSAGNLEYWKSITSVDSGRNNGFALKLSYLQSDRDGWVDNDGPNKVEGGEYSDFNKHKQQAFRAAFSWIATEDFTVDYIFDHSNVDSTPAYFQPNVVSPAPSDGLISFSDRKEKTVSPVTGYRYAYYLPESTIKTYTHGLTFAWELNEQLTLKSITGYRTIDDDQSQNFANSFYTGATLDVHDLTDDEQFTQEVQLLGSYEAISFVSGVYYLDEDGKQKEQQWVTRGTATEFDLGAHTIKNTVESWSVYGQSTWTPNILQERLDLTLGLRYTDDQRTAKRTGDSIQFLPGEVDNDFDQVDWSAKIAFAITDNMMTYASYGTGFRSGGSSPKASDFETGSFAPETLETFELGYKSRFLDDRLQLNLAGFYSQYDDIILDWTPVTGQPQFVQVVNGDDGAIQGFEVDITALLLDGLRLSVNYSHLDYDINDAHVVGQDIVLVLPWAPEDAYSAALDWDIVNIGSGELTAHLDYSWQDDQYPVATEDAFLGRPVVESFGLLNARLSLTGIAWSKSSLDFALWARNLADEDAMNYNIQNSASTFTEPRTYGIDVSVEF